MATDRVSVRIPCCQGRLVLQAGTRALGVESEVVLEPLGVVTAPPRYRLQVAALKDEGQADRLAGWLSERLGAGAEAIFDAGTDLYRVRSAAFATRAEAETHQGELRAEGLEPWVVTEPSELREPGFRISYGDGVTTVPGRRLTIRHSGDGSVRLESGRFRGRILLYLHDRGKLNVINELGLDDYLRGVVPLELGPVAYPSLEALKAQAVAARTYTVRNLGEFEEEGFDICATPRCQVFGGMDVEHPLSDRAVLETRGEVLSYRGELVAAACGPRCGGDTGEVEGGFPLRADAYLRGVPCPERGVEPLSGALERGTPLVGGLMGELLPSPAGPEPAAAESRLRRLAELAGLPVSRGSLRSLDRSDVRRFIGSLFDLVLDARLFTTGAEAALLLDDPPDDWSADDLALAAYLDRTGLLSAPEEGVMSAEDVDEMLFQLSLYLGVLEAREASYMSRDGERVVVKGSDGIESLRPSPELATFHGGEYSQRAAPLVLRPGDLVTAYLHDGLLVGLAQRVDGRAKEGSPEAKVRTWRRLHSDSHLRRVVAERYPEIDFGGFEVVERGVSGRVGKLRLVGRGGRALLVEGLAIRWTLDLPDTLFTARRVERGGHEAGWLFTGRGHGHGVGMCQLGAYGMGLRGSGYQEILGHYYSGVELVELAVDDSPAAAPGGR